MPGQQADRRPFVTGAARLRDLRVLGRAERPAAGFVGDVDSSIPRRVLGPLGQGVPHPPARVAEQQAVELLVVLVPRGEVASLHLVRGQDESVQFVEVCGREPGHADAERQRLVGDSEGVHVLDFLHGELGHRGLVVDLGLDEPLALQQPKGLPDGTPAHPEVLGDPSLRELRPGRDRT